MVIYISYASVMITVMVFLKYFLCKELRITIVYENSI